MSFVRVASESLSNVDLASLDDLNTVTIFSSNPPGTSFTSLLVELSLAADSGIGSTGTSNSPTSSSSSYRQQKRS